jgi:hypothetical protein
MNEFTDSDINSSSDEATSLGRAESGGSSGGGGGGASGGGVGVGGEVTGTGEPLAGQNELVVEVCDTGEGVSSALLPDALNPMQVSIDKDMIRPLVFTLTFS